MNFKYRPHRGGLNESMAETVILDTKSELAAHVSNDFLGEVSEDQLTITPYTFDDRNSWDTHLVCFDGKPIGFTDQMVN